VDAYGYANAEADLNTYRAQYGLGACTPANGCFRKVDQNAGTYNKPGIAITVSSGDSGYGVQFPASAPGAIAVGGTHLVQDGSSRGWNETVWNGAGSGCSTTYTKPGFETDGLCAFRMESDISAVADPATGGGSLWPHRHRQQVGLARVRRYQRRRPGRRRDLCGLQRPSPGCRRHLGQPWRGAERRDRRLERHLRRDVFVHRGRRLRWPDRLGHAQRCHRPLIDTIARKCGTGRPLRRPVSF